MPFEHVPLVLGVGLLRAVVGYEAERALGDVAVEPDLVHGHGLAEIQGEAVPHRPLIDGGGEAEGAQVQQGDDGVDEGEGRQQELVQLQQALALALLKEAQYLEFGRGVLIHFSSPSSMNE